MEKLEQEADLLTRLKLLDKRIAEIANLEAEAAAKARGKPVVSEFTREKEAKVARAEAIVDELQALYRDPPHR